MAWRVIGRLESGQTQRSVADAVGVARSVVARMWNRFKETGNVRRRPGAARPRATTSSYDRMIMPDRIELVWWRTCLKLKQYSVWNGQRALPDLNPPIEHVWDMLGRRIAARPRPPATVRDLEIALLEEWNSIPESLIDNLIASMANSCAAVLAV
ncbi:uncharacterized protein TNCV_1424361 [Trichonephila clavipes]|nr:uncharacterized protein TNCV_1424361 [Trichonephila clavipes]